MRARDPGGRRHDEPGSSALFSRRAAARIGLPLASLHARALRATIRGTCHAKVRRITALFRCRVAVLDLFSSSSRAGRVRFGAGIRDSKFNWQATCRFSFPASGHLPGDQMEPRLLQGVRAFLGGPCSWPAVSLNLDLATIRLVEPRRGGATHDWASTLRWERIVGRTSDKSLSCSTENQSGVRVSSA